MGTLYGIGVGPGDPDYITLKGYKKLQQAPVVFVPAGKNGKAGIAYGIVKEHIPPEAEIVVLDFPMKSLSADREELDAKWQENAALTAQKLKDCDGVFLTLGDPMVFSTYSYITDYLKQHGVTCETIPGIPSFCGLASALSVPLTQGEESFAVVSMTQPENEIAAVLDANQNIVVMKVSAGTELLAKLLQERALENSFILVSNIGMPEERIVTDIKELSGRLPYLSTMLVKKNDDFK